MTHLKQPHGSAQTEKHIDKSTTLRLTRNTETSSENTCRTKMKRQYGPTKTTRCSNNGNTTPLQKELLLQKHQLKQEQKYTTTLNKQKCNLNYWTSTSETNKYT